MIVKILRNKDLGEKQLYWLFDDIKKVSVSDLLKKEPVESNKNVDTIFWDHEEEKYYRRLIFRLGDGSEYVVEFDTVAYICNDVGQTIEKVVGCKY